MNGGGESAVEEEDRGGFCIVRASRRQPILCVPPGNMWTDCPPTFPSVLAAGAQVSRTNTGVHKWWNLFSSQHLGHLQPSMPPQGFQHPPLAPGPPGFSPGSEVSAAQTGQISFWRPSSSELLTSQSLTGPASSPRRITSGASWLSHLDEHTTVRTASGLGPPPTSRSVLALVAAPRCLSELSPLEHPSHLTV